MISAIIPCLNENIDNLNGVISNLADGAKKNELEIIIVNDGSVNDDGSFKPIRLEELPISDYNIKVINNKQRHGVGYSFDRGAEIASGDTIVLMGADVYPKRRKWRKSLENAVKSDELGCGCSAGLQMGLKRYGAKILWTMTHDDLPKNSPLRNDPNYSEIIGCKWQDKKSDEPYEIDAVYGAFYWLTKELYQRMHGFDTVDGERYRGAIYWGHLEAHLSLKARVYGLKCMMYPDIETEHEFSRVDKNNFDKVRSIREDYHYWNRLWIAHTLLDAPLRDKCLNHLKFCKNLSEAKVMAKYHWREIQEVRERNIREGNLIKK
jgi:glycosyltransferase involved in cell wall biosynthesis